ncbi:MAG: hypothetical protein GX629_12625 [Phycisphaerae bacterium]|jgi:hypothetical protein|nr:hypothetical protein [Phycisphaerae bacterium]
MRFLKIPKRTGYLALWILFISLIVGGCGEPYLLTAEDVICSENETPALTAKLEERGIFIFNKPIPHQNVEFFLNDEWLGEGKTNEAGYVKISCPPEQPEATIIRIICHGGADEPIETTATIFTWSKNDPILVADIDDTLCQTQQGLLIGFSYDDGSSPLPGASETMNELAQSFRIIYLTARPRELIAKTKRWLKNNNFPDGPVLTWDIDSDPWSQLGYKQRRLDQLTENFSNITIGIGNTPKDITAYRDHGMFCIFIDPESRPERFDRGVKLPDWTKTLDFFQINPELYDLKNLDSPMKLP